LAADFEEAEKEGNPEVDLRSRGFHFQPKGGTWIHNVGGSAMNTFHNNQCQNRTLTGEAHSSANVMAANQSESTSSGTWNSGVRNLSYQEYLRRRGAKLCYHCGVPFVAGDKCLEKTLGCLFWQRMNELIMRRLQDWRGSLRIHLTI